MTQNRWFTYCQLMRLDKPIGSLLLLWPTLCALWLASRGTPEFSLLFIFIAGVFIMRSAGCVINDFADRHFDGHVKRTKTRPLPMGLVTERACKVLFIILVVTALCLVLMLNLFTIKLSVIALILACLYPFMKRVTHLPQLVLGLAFSWSIPMGFAAAIDTLPTSCWILLLVNVCWTVAYDTQYAMVDREDDIRIGVKSTAILFGRFDKLIVSLLQLMTIALLIVLAQLNQLSNIFYIFLSGIVTLFIYQQKLMQEDDASFYFKAFMNNNYVGLLLFLGIALSV